MTRAIALLCCVALLLPAGVAAGGAAAAVPDARLTVSDVAVSPATPTAGAPLTVEATVASSATSTAPATVDRVELRDGDEVLDAATDTGALGPGDDLTAALSATLDNPGEYDLAVRVVWTDDDGGTAEATRPVPTVIEPGGPALTVSGPDGGPAGPAVAGAETPLTVTVANPTEATLRDVTVTIGGEGLEAIVARRVVAALDPGESAELAFTVRPEAAGDLPLAVTADYATGAGTPATAEGRTVLAVESLEDRVSVRATERAPGGDDDAAGDGLPDGIAGALAGEAGNGDDGDGDGTGPNADGEAAVVTVSNLGNAPITDVVVEPRAAGAALPAQPVADAIPPGEEIRVAVPLDGAPPGELRFAVEYAVAGEPATANTTFDHRPERGAVTVTGVDVAAADEGDDGADRARAGTAAGDGTVADGTLVTVTGNVGNVGDGPVSGVVVAVAESGAVAPAYPQRDFFVGEVSGNAFAPFELAAFVGENATHIPVEVRYAVAGVERTETIRLPVAGIASRGADPGANSSLPVGIAAGVLIVLVSAVVGTVVVRR